MGIFDDEDDRRIVELAALYRTIAHLKSINADLHAALRKLRDTARAHWPRRQINRDIWAYDAAMAQASTAIVRARAKEVQTDVIDH